MTIRYINLIQIPQAQASDFNLASGNDVVSPIQRIDGDYALSPNVLNWSWIDQALLIRLQNFPVVSMTRSDFP